MKATEKERKMQKISYCSERILEYICMEETL
jgi:hypothetical protein